MSKIKVLFLINDITMPGGLSTVTSNLLSDLSEASDRYVVRVLSAASKFDAINDDKIAYVGMPPLHGLTPARKLLWYIRLRKKVQSYIDKNKFDVVIPVGTAMTLFSCFCKFTRAQVWGAEHSAHNGGHWSRKLLKRLCYPKLDRLICLTKSDKHYFYDKFVKQVTVIPNYTNLASCSSYSTSNNSILYVGRFNKVKGVDYLLEVIRKTHPQCLGWSFNLFGEGEDKQWLKDKIYELRLENVVNIHEPSRNIQQEYEKAGVFILTSRNEGFPMVLLEAQANGIPIISFDCETGPNEIVTSNEDGFLIPEYDVDEFSEKLINLIHNSEKRSSMSRKALINQQRFEKKEVLKRWTQLFDTLI